MENLTLIELKTILKCIDFTFANCAVFFAGINYADMESAKQKINQIISDKEFEEKKLNF